NNLPARSYYQSVQGQPDWFLLDGAHTSFLAIPQKFQPSLQEIIQVNYAGDKNMVEITGIAEDSAEERADPPVFNFMNLSTRVVETMLEKVFSGGLKELLQPASQYLREPDFDHDQPTSAVVAPPSALMDLNGAYGPSPWELFYHIPMYMAKQLQADLRSNEAIQWYEVVFDPTGSGRKLNG